MHGCRILKILVLVRVLLADPRVDPTAENNYAVKLASQNGHTKVVELLLKDPKVRASAHV